MIRRYWPGGGDRAVVGARRPAGVGGRASEGGRVCVGEGGVRADRASSAAGVQDLLVRRTNLDSHDTIIYTDGVTLRHDVLREAELPPTPVMPCHLLLAIEAATERFPDCGPLWGPQSMAEVPRFTVARTVNGVRVALGCRWGRGR